MPVTYGFSKVIVADLETSAKFYETVCGLSNRVEVSTHLGGKELTEYVYASQVEGGAGFVLMHYHGETTPKIDESITGFYTDNIEAFVSKATANGASVIEEINERAEFQASIALLRDPEGHIVEVIQPLG